QKIPRPPNSFMIYRREKATNHAGLIAAELSTKLAKAWRNETPETRAHYARLAEQAKAEHTLRYPTYKFTPARR
ncbi:MAG: high mobility group box domain-containing protein, partial [Podila humilis]